VSDVHEEAEANANEESSGGESSRPAWMQGDPDVDRLVAYADNLRNTRAELQDKLAKAESAWDDEDTAYQRVSEKFPHWLDDGGSVESDDDDEYEDDDPREAQLKELADRQAAHDQWITEQKDQAQLRAYHADVDKVQAEKEVEFDQDDRVLIAQKAASYNNDGKPFTKKELEKAVDWLIARDERVAQARLDRLKSSKRAPHVSAGGNAGKGPQPDMDTLEGRTAFYNAKMAEQ
jgi:roadblock/LC7 domain-containing protein